MADKPIKSTRKSSSGVGKSSQGRCSASRKRKQQTHRSPMPLWVRNTLAVAVVLVFSVGFYWFFIRPYAYRWKPCYGMKGYGICMPCGFNVHGIDISHYQGEIDWHRLTTDCNLEFPIHFIFQKATEGGDYIDKAYEANMDSARAHGFICGAYHYFIPQTDARLQAEHFIRHSRLQAGDLPPVLDVETLGKSSPEDLKKAVAYWLRYVGRHYRVKPILYTSYKFKTRYLSDSLFNTYPYWIAHYYVDSVRYEGHWDFWQHTDVGMVSGIEEKVDLNVFNGSVERLDSLLIK